jgi:Maltose acetyltransferase
LPLLRSTPHYAHFAHYAKGSKKSRPQERPILTLENQNPSARYISQEQIPEMASKFKDMGLIEQAKTFENVPWCEDYEKMISGMLHVALLSLAIIVKCNDYFLRYNPFVPELENGRHRARRLVKKFNEYFPDDATPASLQADRLVMLQDIIGKFGENSFIDPPFRVDYGCNISIGADFYGNFK